MLGRQSVKVTYAHRRRRVRNVAKKLFSSPLEVLPPDVDDLTHTQMARRMLKRSRRVALAEQLEDKNVDHIREHLAKRIKHTQERVSNLGPNEGPLDVSPQNVLLFQTPFPSLQSVHESAVAIPLVPEQLSPVPVVRRVMSRTSSRNLKENSAHSQILASPFSSRPGSVASSPKHKGRGRSSRRVSRISLHAKSRTLSGVFKENTRRVSRKDSTVSLEEPSARHIKHRRFPSSPSTAYMRSQFAQEDCIAAPEASSRTFDGYDENMLPGESAYSNVPFYADQPQSCSTPAISRARKSSDPHGRHIKADSFLASFSPRQDLTETSCPDIEMDGSVHPRRRAIHLSGNSIFSSSDEFTIKSLPATHNDGISVESSYTSDQDEDLAGVDCQIFSNREAVDRSQPGHSLTGSFIAEYNIPLPALDHSFASTAATKILGPEGVPKLSVGEQQFDLPGTSPARGENLVIRSPGSRNPVAKSSVVEQPFGLPGTSPARGASLFIVRRSGNAGTRASPASPNTIASCLHSSPASDLTHELQSMDIRGDTHSRGETHCLPASIPLQARSHSLQDAPAEPTIKKSVKRRPARNRAGTIRASDFAKPGISSGITAGSTAPSLSNVRRTRSGTVVGPDSKLVTKGTGLSQATKSTPATRLAPVQSGSESESDDELLLKGFWTEGLEYLGIAVPPDRKDAEPDELNLGGLRHGPPRRLGLRR